MVRILPRSIGGIVSMAMLAVLAVPVGASATVDRSGGLVVEDAGGLQPLPPPDGGPLYPRVRGHLPFGLSDTAWSDAANEDRTLTADQVGALHHAMGATVARMPLYWPHVEPTSGARRWDIYDKVYRALVRHGVRPLWTIFQTPRHLVAASSAFGCNGAHCEAEPAEGRERAVAAFAHDLARRYPLAAGFEFRNEPNHPTGFGRTRVTAERYSELLRAFSAGAKGGRPSARVIGGALVMDAGMEDWLHKFLAAGGAGGMDALSFHPYAAGHDPAAFNNAFGRINAVLTGHGLATMRLVPDEIGASTREGDVLSVGFDELGQRNRLLSQYRLLDTADPSVPGAGNVDAVVFFTTVDGASDSDYGGYGFLRRRGSSDTFTAKSVLCGFRAEVGKIAFALDSELGSCPAVASAAKSAVKKKKAKKKKAKKKAKRCRKPARGRKTPKRCRKVRGSAPSSRRGR